MDTDTEAPITRILFQNHDCVDHVLRFLHIIHLAIIAKVCQVFRERARDLFVLKFPKTWSFMRNQVHSRDTVINMFKAFGDLIQKLEVDENYFDWDFDDLIFDEMIILYCSPRGGNSQNLIHLKLENLTQPNLNHMIAVLPNLQKLELISCYLITKDILFLITQYCTDMRELIVKFCTGSSENNFPMATMIRPNSHFLKLIFYNNINLNSFKIIEYLRFIPNLQQLTLRDSNFDYDSEDFALNVSNLKYLKSLIKLNLNCGYRVAPAFFPTLMTYNTRLISLSIKRFDFTLDCYNNLENIKNLKKLSMTQCTGYIYAGTLVYTGCLKEIERLILSHTPERMTTAEILYLIRRIPKLKYLKVNTTTSLTHNIETLLNVALNEKNDVINVELNTYVDNTENNINASRDEKGEIQVYNYESQIN